MANIIVESFSWMTDAFKVTDIGPNTVRIKGVALRSDIVSKNNRKYVEEEVTKSGRTLINKPFTVNHNNNVIIGNVDWAEPENGVLEYLATVKKQPYVNFIRNRDPRIKGVSVDADYLHAKCVQCGDRFLDIESFSIHMKEEHNVRNFQIEPHQILFKALSLVVDPEVPGVSGTTVELAETLKNKGFLQLAEMLIHERKEMNEKLRKANINIQASSNYAIGRSQKKTPTITEQDEEPEVDHECPDGEVWSDVEKKCVPAAVEQDEEPEACPEGQHRNDAGECVPDTPAAEELDGDPSASSAKPTPECPEGSSWSAELNICVATPIATQGPVVEIEKHTIEKLKLGEPFADFDSFADCVAKNQSKEDPEAYCASLEQKTEASETRENVSNLYALEQYKLEQRRTFDRQTQDIKVLKHAVREYAKDISALKKGLVETSQTTRRIGDAMTDISEYIIGFTDKMNKSFSSYEQVQNKKFQITNASISNIGKQLHFVETRKPYDPASMNKELNTLKESLSQHQTELNLELTALKDSFNELKIVTLEETKQTYETLLGGVDEKYKEYKVDMETKLTEMTAAKQKIEENTLKETAEKDNLTAEKIENLEAQILTLSKFKGNVKTQKSQVDPANVQNPYRRS